MNAADGSNQTRLTFNNAQNSGASWSPDGTKIAFASNQAGNLEIYLMNSADGSAQTRLTNNTANDGEPDW
jgi:Tol biopolymer transport system component